MRVRCLELLHQLHETSILFVGQRFAVISCEGCTLEQFLGFFFGEQLIVIDEAGTDSEVLFGDEIVGRVGCREQRIYRRLTAASYRT